MNAIGPAAPGPQLARPQATPAEPTGVVHYSILGKVNANPAVPSGTPKPDGPCRDVVVIGGGLSGLSALWKLRDKDAVLLESLDSAGGLAAGGHRDGMTYARGAAYFTKPYAQLKTLYRELGLGSEKKVEIHDPVDSYLFDGKLVKDVWGKGLDELPPEFRRFKTFLQSLDRQGMIGQTPLEKEPQKVKELDKLTAAQLIAPFGPRVKEFLDLYCRSAFGSTSEQISAMAFLDFYIDEIGPRYAFPTGTGGVAARLEEKIQEQKPDAINSNAYAYDVHNRPDGLVEVRYNQDGQTHAILAHEVVMATPLSAAAHLIKDLPEERKQAFNSIEHSNYLVHNVFTPKLVYDGSYDTWVKGACFTDVIVGRWQEMKGYTAPGAREGEGILTVYQPLPQQYDHKHLTDAQVHHLASGALGDLERIFPQLKKQPWIDVETSRWPQSMHIARPGQITQEGELLRQPFGQIFFAGKDLGVPSFEEALYRGMEAARGAEQRLDAPTSARGSA